LRSDASPMKAFSLLLVVLAIPWFTTIRKTNSRSILRAASRRLQCRPGRRVWGDQRKNAEDLSIGNPCSSQPLMPPPCFSLWQCMHIDVRPSISGKGAPPSLIAILWSTRNAGVRRPALKQGSHNGVRCSLAFLSLRQGAVLYGQQRFIPGVLCHWLQRA
jgi:hypothetical protein